MSVFMMNLEFNLSLLVLCLSLGMSEIFGGQKSLFFEVVCEVILVCVSSIVQQFFVVYYVFQFDLFVELVVYWSKLNDLFGDVVLYQFLIILVWVLVQYLVVVFKLFSYLYFFFEKEKDIMKFVVVIFEVLFWYLIYEQILLSLDFQVGLDCCCLVLQLFGFWSVVFFVEFVIYVCFFIYCVYFILEVVVVQFGEQFFSLERRINILKVIREEEEEVDLNIQNLKYIIVVCEMVVEMVEFLQLVLVLGYKRNSGVLVFFMLVFRNIVVSLVCLFFVNSYICVFLLVWKFGWLFKLGGDFGIVFFEIFVEFFQEKEVFKEFIYCINILGWISCIQFEEIWVIFFGVLVMQFFVMEQEESLLEEDIERIQINVLVVQVIILLVFSVMIVFVVGNLVVSCLEQQFWNKFLKVLDIRFGRKLSIIRGIVE